MSTTAQTPVSGNAKLLIVPIIIWVALQFSQGLYFAVLVHTVNRFHSQSPQVGHEKASSYLMVLGLVEFLFAIGLPFIMAQYKARQLAQVTGSEVTFKQIIQKLLAVYIVRLALLESVAILGLVAATRAHSVEASYGYFVVSVAGFLFSFPSESFFRRWASGRFN